MTDESEGSKSAPGAGAGDAAPTQAIPRIPKPVSKTTPAKKTAATGKGSPSVKTETDKGRPRPAGSTPAVAKAEPKGDRDPAPKPRVQPVTGPSGRPLTASDYARTTKGSPEATSVIPAVKDVPRDDARTAPVLATDTQAPGPSGRRASLRLTHIEPWSVTRLAFAISVAMMIVAVVAVAIFWVVLDVVGVWDQINDSFTTVLADNSSSFNVTDYFGLTRVVGLTLVLSAVNVILATALATIAAHLYNLAAQLMGGIGVTFSEE